jgi:N-acyl-D-amino-acid deacylase
MEHSRIDPRGAFEDSTAMQLADVPACRPANRGASPWLRFGCSFALALLAAGSGRAADPVYDFVLRHGRIMDGTGNPSFHGDVAVKDGRIAAIGRIAGTGKSEFDAEGLVVAPGFIDVHTHAEDIDDQPLGENFVRMGVTTLVLGNCGSSALNVGQYFRNLEAITISPNVATLVGHGTVRRTAMHGSFDRPPTEAELEQMRALVRRGMEDGAVGISTGLIYLPGVFAKTEELIEVAKVASAYDGIYATHQRSESQEIFESLDEIFRIAREAHIRVEVSHLKLSGPANWGKAAQVLEAIEKARASGLDVTQDQYAYTASSTGMSQLVPESAREGGGAKFRERLENPELKAKMVEQMRSALTKRMSTDYSYAVIASYRPDRTLNGLNIAEAAKKVRGADTVDDQIEMILEIEKNGGATGVFHGMDEGDLEVFMRHPNTMFASDSGVRRPGSDVPHPRGYGNNARVLGRYIREKKVVRLEEAIRKMTLLPAQTFHLAERGELRPGYWADLAVFDPRMVEDHATYADPHHFSTGFRYVFVNGTLVVERDLHTGARPGKVLRREAHGKQPALIVETHAMPAAEAGQAAAADERFVYAIDSAVIGKYDRTTGQLLGTSMGEAHHMNSGFLWEGKLYCAHSNYPGKPEHSEIKVLDPETMALTTFKDFGESNGSLTWAVREGGAWWCTFAFYGPENARTRLVKFDDQWREVGVWTYPPEVVKELGQYSISGGIFQDGRLLATGHDRKVVYCLRVPEQPGVLELVGTLPAPFPGQGIASDAKTGGIVGINRGKKQVVFGEMRD